MAITRDQKAAQLSVLTDKMKNAQSIVFAHYIGLSVAEVSELRAKLKEVNAEMKVAKKTLMQLAAKDAGLPELDKSTIDGPVSIIFNNDDPLSGAQIAFKFAKKHKQVELIGGMFDGKILSKAEAMELAQMPGREELLAKFVGMIRSPLVSFASMCNSPLSSFARALDQLAEKGGLADAPAPAKTEEKAEAAPAAEAPAAEEAAEAPADEAAATDETAEAPDAAADEAPAEEAAADDDSKADA